MGDFRADEMRACAGAVCVRELVCEWGVYACHTHIHTRTHTSFDSGGARSPPRERGEVGGGGGGSGGRTKSAPSARSKSVERPRSARGERDMVYLCVCVRVCVYVCLSAQCVRRA
jgi:hypothetical protein